MKKRIASLLLALVMALALFPAAVAAENTAPLLVSGLAQGQTGFLAGYNDQGRMVGLRMLTADGEVAAIPGATSLKLIRTDGSYVPQGPALTLAPSSGTVRKVDGQVRVCYDGPDGLTVSQAVTEKMTGSVATYGIKGTLRINGKVYSATDLPVEGCDYTVSRDGFRTWTSQPNVYLGDTLDFYLDSAGNICWIELVKAYVHPVDVCLILSVSVTDSADGDATIQAQMMRSSGWAGNMTVSILNGEPVTDPDAAVAQLSASAPGGLYACQLQRDGGYSLTAVDNAAGSGWGQTVRLPYDIPVYPQADFTQGAVSCAADENTRFYVVQDDPKEGSIRKFYYSFDALPTEVVLDGYIVTDEADPTVARFVYLHIAAAPPPLPKGYVFLPSTGWRADPELYEDDVYLVDIVDIDSSAATMRVTASLKNTIAADRMTPLGSYWGNTLVGRFCAVTEIDEYGVVSDLEPAAAVNVQSIEDGVISLADGVTYGYDSDTKFIYVDMMWADDLDDPYNKFGVREPSRDKWVLAESGIFDPEGFFDAADVDATGAYSDSVEEQNPNGATYISVRAAVIPEKDDPTLADWVYVVRQLW